MLFSKTEDTYSVKKRSNNQTPCRYGGGFQKKYSVNISTQIVSKVVTWNLDDLGIEITFVKSRVVPVFKNFTACF